MENIKILTGEVPGYRLLDSGEKEKLEEINGIKIVRKEPRAWWRKTVDSGEWLVAKKELETILDIGIGGVKAKVNYSDKSKHIGIFPEQAGEWQWIIKKVASSQYSASKKLNILNLFGYTGIASLAVASCGVKVTHVDASKQSIDWAKENQKLSGLEGAPIRWIVDDAVKFLKREVKRGEKYDAIIMDPPSYGRGPKGEVWKIEDRLPSLLATCREVLSEIPIFVILNLYSTELSSISVGNLLSDMINGLSGKIEVGELAIKKQDSEKLLPMSIFAVWSAK